MLPLVYVLALLLLLSFLIKLLYFNPPTTKKNLPPSPPKFPLIGNLHQLGPVLYDSLLSLAQKHGGPLMLIHMGSVPILVVSSAEAAHEIMKTHDLVFSNRPNTKLMQRLLCGMEALSFAPYGEYWRQARSIMNVHLLSNKMIEANSVIREEEIGVTVEKLMTSSRNLEVVDLRDMFGTFTNDVLCRVTFGRKYGEGESGKKFRKMLEEFFEVLGGTSFEDFIPQLVWVDKVRGFNAKVDRVGGAMNEFVDGVVEERRRMISIAGGGDAGGVEPFVDAMLKIQKEGRTGVRLDNLAIKAFLLDAYTAGADTTATTLEWIFVELLKHPIILKKVQDEVRTILKGKQQIYQDDIDNMKYLKAVLKETLRLHPPIPTLLPREVREDVKVMGYEVVKGTWVITNAWAIARDPKVWDYPNEFRPERFLNCAIDFKGRDLDLIPFGSGRRACPGISFAMTTTENVLANLLNKFDWRFPNGGYEDDLSINEQHGLLIRTKNPLLVVMTPVGS